jgi:hypothetical protein
MRRAARVGLVVLMLAAFAAPGAARAAAPAQATPGPAPGQAPGEAFVVLSGPADVPAGREVSGVVVFQGSSTVDGTVNGSVTAFDAPVTVSGRVNGDVVVFNGPVELRRGATVTGDVVSQQPPVVAQGATIGGQARRVSTNVNWNRFGWVSRFAWWLGITISTLVIGLVLLGLAGRGADAVLAAGRTAVGPAIGWGLALVIGLPIVAVIALFTIVGIPLGVGLLAALGLIHAIGWCAGAWFLGRSIVRPPTAPILAFLAGWAILRVLALVPVLGGILWFVAVVFGLGALAVALWRARAGGRGRIAPAAA